MNPVDPKPDEESEACPKSKPQKPRPNPWEIGPRRKKPETPTGHLPPLDQIPAEIGPVRSIPNQIKKTQTKRCAKCGERALAETVRKGRCIGCQVEAYLDTL